MVEELSASRDYRIKQDGTCGIQYSPIVRIGGGAPPEKPSEGLKTYFCQTGSISLTASAPPADTQTKWYSSPTSNAAIYTGTSFTTFVNSTEAFYISNRNINSGCESDRAEIQAIYTDKPSSPQIPNVSACGTNQTITLSSPLPLRDSLHWFTTASGSTQVYQGDHYTLTVSSNTTVYVSRLSSNGECESERVPVNIVFQGQAPSAPTLVANPSRIAAGPVTFQVQSSTTESFRWYNASNQLILNQTGETYTGWVNPGDVIKASAVVGGCAKVRSEIYRLMFCQYQK